MALGALFVIMCQYKFTSMPHFQFSLSLTPKCHSLNCYNIIKATHKMNPIQAINATNKQTNVTTQCTIVTSSAMLLATSPDALVRSDIIIKQVGVTFWTKPGDDNFQSYHPKTI